MKHLDEMSASHHEGDRKEGFNGKPKRIEEFRAVLQLPNYSLITEGLFSNFQPPREPAVNI
ncbi:hypothetical protein JG687_00012684 [Phytophthora cactorum]|uniref:Uncharacterized protein n=1 Tax=Phytophthora cactorum TaxID=29920 RepID=A0A8T1U144_9STRA|nr:hypothetical protein JG687_00012684 [Phytophthora cactorum]